MKLDVFIEGELIDLCVPTKEFAEKSDWYSWLNDPTTTRYLDHGLFPNNPTRQVDFYETNKNSRLILIISDKQNYVGAVNLSSIDLTSKQAVLGMVLSRKKNFKMLPFLGLEAIARITEHAFKVMGLNRLNSGQHVDLDGWQQRKEILGYRIEGIKRKAFVKGREVADIMISSLIYDDYLRIVKTRGKYWDSFEQMKQRIEKLPKDKFVNRLKNLLSEESEQYYDQVFKL